jgi:hypothetical protein
MSISCWYTVYMTQSATAIPHLMPPHSHPMHQQGCDITLTVPGIHICSAVTIPDTDPDDGHHQKINVVTQLWCSWSPKKFQCIHLSRKLQPLCRSRHLFVYMHVNMIYKFLYTVQLPSISSEVKLTSNQVTQPNQFLLVQSVLQGCLYTIRGTQWRLCTKCRHQQMGVAT